MIFYFTGTGNSQYVAQSMLGPEERLISIKEAVEKRTYTYEVGEGEKIGFVCPVYFGGLPTIVIHFIHHLRLTGQEPVYTYVILTNGGGPMGADRMFRTYMGKKGYPVDILYSLTMPDNYCILYDVPSEKEEGKILAEAEARLSFLKKIILDDMGDTDRESTGRPAIKSFRPYHSGKKEKAATALLYPLYIKGRKTKKFWVDDQCVGCCACQNRCPSHAIKLIEGRPVWVKDRCVQCFGCMRCGAIHYGQADAKHGRYKHPIFRKKH